MQKLLMGIAGFVTLGIALVQPAQAAPRQLVVVVAEGVNPQVMQFGADYSKSVVGEEDATSALADLKMQKTMTAEGVTFEAMKGLLKTAAANGWKTGLVTTGSAAKDAATLYGVDATGADAAKTLVADTKFNFIAGGGRADFNADLKKSLTAAGGTALFDAESVENGETELKGKTLILQSDAALSYAIDQNPENEVGLGELVSLGTETLAGENNAPYMLVVHDTNVAKALAAKDTPALAEELRTLDGIIGDVISQREDNESLVVAVIATGSNVAPSFATQVAADHSNAFFILSALPMSFAKAGTALTGANDEAITTFANDEYKGWKI